MQVDDRDLKISNQRRYTDSGEHPLPIYTAVRHEIPLEAQREASVEAAKAKAQKEAWFQWFEFTPYEFWCEELAAGIPTWAIGRQFEGGKTQWPENGLALPELRIPLLMGIWGSAFCATLSHYYKEIRPIMKNLAGFGGIDSMLSERDDDLVKIHPIDPANIPNFALGMRDQLSSSVPESIHSTTNLQLMDAGMSNNLPIYPLLRPGRNVDILIAFDASADVQTDNWLRVVDGYARQRGIKGWPIGAGWPTKDESKEQISEELEAAQASTESEAQAKVTGTLFFNISKYIDNPLNVAKNETEAQQEQKANPNQVSSSLGYCNVWVGTTEERMSENKPPTSKLVEEDWELMKPEAGVTVIYYPFIANPKIEGVDPKVSDFMSTWNFIYTPDQIDKVVSLAKANFEEGKDQTKRTVRAVYERKKSKRLQREKEEREGWKRFQLRRGALGKKLGEGDHCNHFS